MSDQSLEPGSRVSIRKRFRAREMTVELSIEGVVLETQTVTYGPYAGGPKGVFYARRLIIRKSDGELTSVILSESCLTEPLA